MALELPNGVRMNSINPGIVVTELFSHAGMSDEDITRFLERQKEAHLLGRVGEAEEVAKVMAFHHQSINQSINQGIFRVA